MIQSFRRALLVLTPLLPSTVLGQDQKLTPDELYQRMFQSASIHADTAYGWYIERIYNAPKGDHPEVEGAIKAIEASRAKRAARGESLKGEPDIASIREHLEGVAKQTTWTWVQTYYVSGNRFRMNQSKLPNDQPLEQLRALVLERWKGRPPESVTLSDGESCKQLDYFDDKAKDGHEAARKAVLKLLPKAPKQPAFLSFGREVGDASFLKTFRDQGLPLRVQQVRTKGGEDALALKIGADGTVGLWLEMIVLPGKGYATTESTTKMQGAVLLREELDQLVQTSAGFWIPMRIKRESYRLSSLGVPELSTRQELLALEPPKVNIPIDEKLFDVTPTKDTLVIDSLHAGGTPVQPGGPLVQPPGGTGQVPPLRPRSGSRLVLVVLNALFILGLLGVFILRKWWQRRQKSV